MRIQIVSSNISKNDVDSASSVFPTNSNIGVESVEPKYSECSCSTSDDLSLIIGTWAINEKHVSKSALTRLLTMLNKRFDVPKNAETVMNQAVQSTGEIRTYRQMPIQVGLKRSRVSDLVVGNCGALGILFSAIFG